MLLHGFCLFYAFLQRFLYLFKAFYTFVLDLDLSALVVGVIA